MVLTENSNNSNSINTSNNSKKTIMVRKMGLRLLPDDVL